MVRLRPQPARPRAPRPALFPLRLFDGAVVVQLAGGFAREKMIRTQDAIPREYHPPRLQPGHGGISQWDHASPKVCTNAAHTNVPTRPRQPQ